MRLGSGFEVLGLRDFRLVFGAALASLLGDGIVPVALAFAVLDLTGSATDLGIVLAARTVALVGSLLVGGVIADRVSRRTVMMAADIVRLLGQAAIGVLLVSGHATVAELAVSQALLGAGTGFFNPASSGLIPTIAGERLQQATSLRGMAMATGNIIGPAIGGVLVVAISPGAALLLDAGSYAVSALLLARVGRDLPGGEPQRFLAELRDGFAQVRSRSWLWGTVVALSVVNMASAAFIVLGPLVAKRQLGGAGAWALILALMGVGALIGGSVLLRVVPRRPLLVGTLIGIVPVGQTALLAIPAPLALIGAAALLAGVGEMAFNTLWETTLQQQIPPAVRSRVSSYDWFGSLALRSIGLIAIGPFAAAAGASTALYACAGLEFVMVVSLLWIRDIRTLAPRPVTSA
ncbi:MAG: MFS transporter [Solirubrobacteraceae bacterium]